jgi:hypothetical protein
MVQKSSERKVRIITALWITTAVFLLAAGMKWMAYHFPNVVNVSLFILLFLVIFILIYSIISNER